MNLELKKTKIHESLSSSQVSELIQMALSDHVTFDDIYNQFGLKESDIKKIMRRNLKFASYRTWRKRVSTFSKRREFYK